VNNDEQFMNMALEEAMLAGAAGDVPVGAIVVVEGEVVGRGRNRRRSANDPTAHAEIEALRAASQAVGNWRVEGTMYVTQEPCPMCAGALVNARLLRLVYGCDSPKSGAIKTLFTIATDQRLNHRIEVEGGVLGDRAAELLSNFFRTIREGSP
jgi:tRNA(adenine34) deaminase